MPFNSFDNYYMSWTPVLDRSGGSLATQIAQQLEWDIRDHKLLPGTKLPPYRELADYLDVNLSTVTRAFKLCREKGLLSGTVGSATYVSYDALASVYLKPQPEDGRVIPLGPLYPAVHAEDQSRRYLRQMAAEGDLDKWFGYGAPEGSENQRIAALRVLEKAGLRTQQERLVPAAGGQNAITGILAGLFRRGDRLGVDPLTYPGLKTAAKMLGIELVPVRQENGEMSEAGLLHAVRSDNIRGIYVMPDVQNPTTHIMSEEGRQRIARIAKEEEILVIEDSANSLTLSSPRDAIATYASEQTVYIGSLSKAIAPGLRLSYIACPDRWRPALQDAMYNINLALSPFLMELATRLLASDDVFDVIENNRRQTVARNRIFEEEMAGFEAAGTDECLFRWVTLPNPIDGPAFEAACLAKGVEVYAGHRFAVGKTKPPDALRISVTSPRTDDELRQALRILKKIVLHTI